MSSHQHVRHQLTNRPLQHASSCVYHRLPTASHQPHESHHNPLHSYFTSLHLFFISPITLFTFSLHTLNSSPPQILPSKHLHWTTFTDSLAFYGHRFSLNSLSVLYATTASRQLLRVCVGLICTEERIRSLYETKLQ